MNSDYSDVVNLWDDVGTESINMNSGSIPGSGEFRFTPLFSVGGDIRLYNNSWDTRQFSIFPLFGNDIGF